MQQKYDMNVDLDTICNIENNLQRINKNLGLSVRQMSGAINSSSSFLSGNQFEKAKRTTQECIGISNRASQNIENSLKYLTKLKRILEEYCRCTYSEG